ncbi:MAG: T9SS type A sorting domain-containing protein [Bacteroidota bacterium]
MIQILKNLLVYAVLGVTMSISIGQTTLLQESFETDGETLRYTSNSGDDATLSDIWDRTDQNPHPYHAVGITSGTLDGSWYWIGEDVFSLLAGADAFVSLNALNVSGQSNLDVQIAIGMSRFGQNRWENDDYFLIEYNMDGAGWNIIGLFTGDNPGAALGGALKLDTDNNPATFGPFSTTEVTGTFVDHTFSIPATGNSLEVRVRTNCNGSEEIGFDNIRIRGIMSTNSAPVLANIEPNPIAYAEGDPAVQVTNTLTISDADDVNLDSIAVGIVSGYDPTEDVLSASPVGGIVATFNSTFGLLLLKGSASLADYETSIRSVMYQNTDAIDASTETRTLIIQAHDGIDFSNMQSRDIDVSASLDTTPLVLPFCESFEDDGQGLRYESNHFDSRPTTCNFAEREVEGTDAGGCYAEVLTGADGSFVFNTEDTDANGGFTLTSQDFDISTFGLADITIDLLLGVSRDDEARWENDDQLRVEYSIDGGGYTIVGLFTGDNAAPGIGGNLFEDTDQDTATFGPFSANPVPDVFTNYSFSFQGSGNTMTYRIVVLSNGTEELAFDNICLSAQSLCTNDTTNLSATTCDSSMVGVMQSMFTNQGGCDSLVITTTTLDPPTDAGLDAMISLTEGDSVDLDTLVSISGGSYHVNDSSIGNIFQTAGLGDTTIVISYIVASTTTCPDDTATITLTIKADPMSIESLLINGQEIHYILFPNPTAGVLYLESSDHVQQSISFDIRNVLGQVLQQGDIAVGQLRHQLSVSHLPTGLYYLRFLHPEGQDAILRFEKIE